MAPDPARRPGWKPALILTAFAALCALLLQIVQQYTAPRIAAGQLAERQLQLQAVLQDLAHDNLPAADCTLFRDADAFADTDSHRVYRVRQQDQARALIYEAVAHDGYSGDIHLLIGLDMNNRVTGVRVTAHRETPGLGDKIERNKSPWIDSFSNRIWHESERARWAVKKDGGEFDAFTGATITPRAVIASVQRIARLHSQRAAELFAAAANCQTDAALPDAKRAMPAEKQATP